MTEESKQFWGNIWSQSADHKKDAKWLQDLRSEVNVKKQEKIDITTCNCKSDICTFRSGEVVTRRAERVQERF